MPLRAWLWDGLDGNKAAQELGLESKKVTAAQDGVGITLAERFRSRGFTEVRAGRIVREIR
jgi:hypothetical protein